MANVEFLEPTGSNLSNEAILGNGYKVLTPGHGANKAWIYSNYPEAMGLNGKGMAIAGPLPENCNKSYYLNQQTVSGEAEVFFSHNNHSSQSMYCRVQLYNPNSTSVSFTVSNIGYVNGWNAGLVWDRYYRMNLDPTDEIAESIVPYLKSGTITSEGAVWITPPFPVGTTTSEMGNPFSGVVHLSVSQDTVVTVYAYRNEGSVTGESIAFPYDFTHSAENPGELNVAHPGVYTGIGDEFNLSFNHGTIFTSNLPYKYVTNDSSDFPNNEEIIPIRILGENLTADINQSTASGLNNLANWCVHNFHYITFKNTLSQQVSISAYLYGAADGATPVILCNGQLKYVELSTSAGHLTWKWCTITLAPNETFNFNYQHILGTYGNGCQVTEWRLE